MPKAVVDVGSNSVLLLVGELSNNKILTIYESSSVTGLGTGTKQTGLLMPEKITSTLEALATAKAGAAKFGAESVTYAATMAVRIAKNAAEFCEAAAHQGTPITILSGEDEAQLGLESVLDDSEFSDSELISIIDPGGHSTELVTAQRTPKGFEVLFKKSFAVGALGLREAELAPENCGPMQIFQASNAIDQILGDDYDQRDSGLVVTLGATGTNLITIRDKVLSWDPELVHGKVLDYEEISRAMTWMMQMTDAQRAAIPGIEPGRERTIHAGALILERFLYAIKAESCRVSVRGWRHALLRREFER